MNPKISVIIPVYNTERYLKECLDSVVNQTLKDIEIIIVNDASPDNSISIINDYASNDGRIVVIDKKNNEGVGQARNDGILKATGEFIAFMDSDDLYSSNVALNNLYSAAIENKVSVSGGVLEILRDEIVEKTVYPQNVYGLDFEQSSLMNYFDYQYDYGYTQFIFNRKLIINNDIRFPSYSRFQDPPFFVKAMFKAGKYFFINESVYRYRLIGDSSKYTVKKTVDMLCGIIDNLEFSRNNDLSKLHCLTAYRLDKEGSFMAIKNISDKNRDELIAKFIQATSKVDVKWLNDSGFDFPDPFVPEVFEYALDTAAKYEDLRNNKILRAMRKIKNG